MYRHKRSNHLLVALLLALLLPVLAACGGTTPNTPSTGTQSSTAAPSSGAPEATAAPAPTGSDATSAPAATSGASSGTTSGSTSGSGSVLRIADSTWPDTLAPQKSSFSNEIAVLIMNYEGLTRFDKDLKT